MPQPSSASSVPWSHPARKPVAGAASPIAVQQPSGTPTAHIQSFCAQAALFFLPMPALKHPSIRVTVADLFLVPAVLLNLGYGLWLQWFQMLVLLALPLHLLSHMLDPSGVLISILQMALLWAANAASHGSKSTPHAARASEAVSCGRRKTPIIDIASQCSSPSMRTAWR